MPQDGLSRTPADGAGLAGPHEQILNGSDGKIGAAGQGSVLGRVRFRQRVANLAAKIVPPIPGVPQQRDASRPTDLRGGIGKKRHQAGDVPGLGDTGQRHHRGRPHQGFVGEVGAMQDGVGMLPGPIRLEFQGGQHDRLNFDGRVV